MTPGIFHTIRAVSALAILMVVTGCAVGPQSLQTSSYNTPRPTPRAPLTLGELLPPNSLPARDEELWVIEKKEGGAAIGADNKSADAGPIVPGCGMLLDLQGGLLRPFPLEFTKVDASVLGAVARVSVHQRFVNDSKQPAQVAYAFPLPDNAAVDGFVLTIGQRHIRAILRERADAEEIYAAAKGMGLVASLLIQQDDNLFVQRIDLLGPGRAVDVDLSYYHLVTCRDGWCELRIPLVAGPRGGGIHRPPLRSGKDITVHARLDPAMPIARIEAPGHTISIAHNNDHDDVDLVNADAIPNRDLLIRYEVGGEEVRSSLVADQAAGGQYFALTLIPPTTIAKLPRQPIQADICVLGDARAGAQAATALLSCLTPDDTFRVIGPMTSPTDNATPATARAIQSAVNSLSSHDVPTSAGRLSLDATMANAIVADPPAQEAAAQKVTAPAGGPRRQRWICVIADEHGDALLQAPPALRNSRAMVLAIAVSPRTSDQCVDLLAAGHGAALYLPPNPQTSRDLIGQTFDRITHPAITDVSIQSPDGRKIDLLPGRLPALCAGHAVTLLGRVVGDHVKPVKSVIVSASVGGRPCQWSVSAIDAAGDPAPRSAIASLWARRRIAQWAQEGSQAVNQDAGAYVRQMCLDYGLLSRFTAFVVVDATPAPGK